MVPVEPDQELRQMGKTIIGYVGVLGVQDGVDYLLRALNHLLRGLGRNDFYCVIVGFGDALEDLKRLAQELALEDHVHFTGPIFGEKLRQLLAAADICVDSSPANPYTDRSTMFKIMEYMSLRKPIVAFDLPEHRFTARGAAVYVTPNDERAFARALAKLMDDPESRMALGTTGSGRIKTQLAWDYSVPNLLSAYSTVLPEAKIPQAAPEAEVLGELGPLGAMHAAQVGRELDADNNPQGIQPDGVLSPAEESTAFPV
jgi:glycosyltransferase involved in cell wall biosynthesis